MYTDEAHGYGNAGTYDPPAQTVLDSQPQPANNTPNLDDAAWTAAAGDNAFSDSGNRLDGQLRRPELARRAVALRVRLPLAPGAVDVGQRRSDRGSPRAT